MAIDIYEYIDRLELRLDDVWDRLDRFEERIRALEARIAKLEGPINVSVKLGCLNKVINES